MVAISSRLEITQMTSVMSGYFGAVSQQCKSDSRNLSKIAALNSNVMYQSNRSLNIPPGIPRAFDVFCCPVGREFELSLLRDGAFDHYS